jgi:hypothetical protein
MKNMLLISWYVPEQFLIGCAAEFQTVAGQVEQNYSVHNDG